MASTPVMQLCYPGYPIAEVSSRGLAAYTCSGSLSNRTGCSAQKWDRGRRERSRSCLCAVVGRLEVGCCVGTSAGVVILLQVGLEGRGTCVGGLVAKRGTGAGHEIVVVLGDACLALLHAPEDEGDAAKEERATDAADDAANDLLVVLAQAAATAACRAVGHGRIGDDGLAGGGDMGAGAGRRDLGGLAVDDGAVDGGVEANRGGDERRGADEGCGAD